MSRAASERLQGRTLFMSASVPDPKRAWEFHRGRDAAAEIEQAVVSLTRAVLSAGGRLVFGGHPAISPLVAMVAEEYRPTRFAESGKEAPPPRVLIYQSDLFREVAPRATMLMSRLRVAEIRWIEKDPHETPGERGLHGSGYRRSLERMRVRMIEETDPDCMVCIGGMEGVLEEWEVFAMRYPERKCYVLRSTGGASALLGTPGSVSGSVGRFDFIDERIMAQVRERPRTESEDGKGPRFEDVRRSEMEPNVLPYPLIAQTIVEELAGDGE